MVLDDVFGAWRAAGNQNWRSFAVLNVSLFWPWLLMHGLKVWPRTFSHMHLAVFVNKGSQSKPQKAKILIMGTPITAPLIVGNPHLWELKTIVALVLQTLSSLLYNLGGPPTL